MAAKNAALTVEPNSIPTDRPLGSWLPIWLPNNSLEQPQGSRKLNAAGMQAVERTADLAASKVDELLGKGWSRREGKFTG